MKGSGQKGSSIQMKQSHAEFGNEANEFGNELVKSGSESTIGRMQQTRYCVVEQNAVNLKTSMNVTT